MKTKKHIYWVILLIAVFSLNCSACRNQSENDARSAISLSAPETASGEEAGTAGGKEVLKITDCAGREVEINRYAKKVVDLTYGDGIRTLVELGAQNTLVGMSDMDHDLFDPEDKFSACFIIVRNVAPELRNVMNVGNHKEPNVQLIMSVEPDVIFMQRDLKQLADTLQKQTRTPVVCLGAHGTLDLEIFRIAGKILGREERAEELIAFSRSRIKKVTAVTDDIPEEEKPRVFFWVRPFIDDPRTDGNYEPLEAAGAINVAADAVIKPNEMFKISKEQIAAWNPEIILRHTGSKDRTVEEGWHTIESILNEPVLQGVRAVKDKKVYPTEGYQRGWDPATGITEVLYLAKIIYPERFTFLDVEKEGNEILEKFYGVDGLYTEMVDFLHLYDWD